MSSSEQQRGRQRGPRGASRPPRRERQHDHQEAWGSHKRSPSKKPKAKQNVWKDVPEHDRNVHKVGAVGHRLPEEALPLPVWPARPDSWPTKGRLDDEATHYLDLVPVKGVEWIVQNTDNGGFKCSHSDNGLAEQYVQVSPSIAEDMEEDNLCGAGQ